MTTTRTSAVLAVILASACNGGVILPSFQSSRGCPDEPIWSAEKRWMAVGVVAHDVTMTKYTPSGVVEWEMQLPHLDENSTTQSTHFDFHDIRYHAAIDDGHVFVLNDLSVLLHPSGEYELSIPPAWDGQRVEFDHRAADGTRITGERHNDDWGVSVELPSGEVQAFEEAWLFQCSDEVIVTSYDGEPGEVVVGEGWRRIRTTSVPVAALKRGDDVELLAQGRAIPNRYTRCEDFTVPWGTVEVDQYEKTTVMATDFNVQVFPEVLHPRAELCRAVPYLKVVPVP